VHLKTPARLYTAVFALTLLLGSATAQFAYAEPPKSAASISSIRIDNFGQIDSAYYRGGQPQGQDYADLAAVGVKTIINLTSDDAVANEKDMAVKAGLAYFQIPMTTRVMPTAAQLTEFLKLVNDPKNQPVYVHCVGGRHRTGVMTAAYRITHDGWSADQAFKEMKQYKFGADFLHPEFKQFVFAYPGTLATAAAATAVAQKTIGQ